MPRPSLHLLAALAIVPSCGLAQTVTSPSEQPHLSGTATVQYASYDSKSNRVVLLLARAPHDRNLQLLARNSGGRPLTVTITTPKPHESDPAYNGVYQATLLAGGRQISYSPNSAPNSGAFAIGGTISYAASPTIRPVRRPPAADKATKGLRDCPTCTGTLSFVQDIGDDLEAPTSWVLDADTGLALTADGGASYDPSITLQQEYFGMSSTTIDAQTGINFYAVDEPTCPFCLDSSPGITFNNGTTVNETTGEDSNVVTGYLAYGPFFDHRTPCPQGSVVWDSNGLGDVGCDNAFVYAAAPGYTALNNLSSPAIEGFNFADAPYDLGSYSNSLEYLFGNITQGAVVANPLYGAPCGITLATPCTTFGSISSLGPLSRSASSPGQFMPNGSQFFDYRTGRFSRVYYNWGVDPLNMDPNRLSADSADCILNTITSDVATSGMKTTDTMASNCENSVYVGSVPGWNALAGNKGSWYVTKHSNLNSVFYSAGIKAAISSSGYAGGAGDVDWIDINPTWKLASTGSSDQGGGVFVVAPSEALPYEGTSVGYNSSPGDNVITATPTANAAYVGVGQMLLDLNTIATGTATLCTGCDDPDGSTITIATLSPSIPSASITGSIGLSGVCPGDSWSGGELNRVATADPSLCTGTRDPDNKGVLTQFDVMVPSCSGAMPVCITASSGSPVLLGKFSLSDNTKPGAYEVVSIQSAGAGGTSCAGTAVMEDQCLTAYLRLGAVSGAQINAGGLVGSYIVFPDYTQTVSCGTDCSNTFRYAQYVYRNTTTALTFGYISQGDARSNPEYGTNAPSTFNIAIYQGGDVEDVRDPTTGSSATSCNTASKTTMQADGCWFMVEDNNAPWASGDAIESPNHIAAVYNLFQEDLTAQNPYADVIFEQLAMNSTGGAASGQTGILLSNSTPPADLAPLTTSGLFWAPLGMHFSGFTQNGSAPIGMGLFFDSPPIGTEAVNYAFAPMNGRPDLIGVYGIWPQCASSSVPNCTLDFGPTPTGYYFWHCYNFFDQLYEIGNGTKDPPPGKAFANANGQTDSVCREGTRTISNYGTTFQAYGETVTNPIVTIVGSSGGGLSVTAGITTDTITCTSSPCGTLKGTTSAIGGSELAAGACVSGTATIEGATTNMVATVSPVSDPQGGSNSTGIVPYAWVSSANTVTVRVCALTASTPVSTTYNVRVEP